MVRQFVRDHILGTTFFGTAMFGTTFVGTTFFGTAMFGTTFVGTTFVGTALERPMKNIIAPTITPIAAVQNHSDTMICSPKPPVMARAQ
jgi:hypothetical protein